MVGMLSLGVYTSNCTQKNIIGITLEWSNKLAWSTVSTFNAKELLHTIMHITEFIDSSDHSFFLFRVITKDISF